VRQGDGDPAQEQVAVIGGGISGMTAAYYLVRAGKRVTIYESADQFGGLGTFFPYRHTHLERFYHCLLPGDENLLTLLKDLGIAERAYWHTAEFGFMHRGTLYGLNTPMELLRFSPLALPDRVRVGVTALYGSLCSSRGLDDITSEEWLTRLCGARAFELFWKPMFQAKFGERYHDIPALWFWQRFNREKGTKKEVKGYIKGGYKFLTDSLVRSLADSGAKLRTGCAVESLDLDDDGRPRLRAPGGEETYDQVVVTTPLPSFRRITSSGRIREWADRVDSGIDYQGVINAVFLLKKGLTDYYWVAAMDDDVPYQGIVESSVLLEKDDTGGHHLAYLMNYMHRTDPRFTLSDEEIAGEYTEGMKKMFPGFSEDDVVDTFVFRDPHVEPLYSRGYLKRKPPAELVPGRVYLATSSQVYPSPTSWDSCAGFAKRVAEEMLSPR